MWGEHRMQEKYNPYAWATEYPLIMRWGNRLPVDQLDRLVPNVDFGATLLDVAGVTPSFPVEGTSVFESFRSDVVLEGIAVKGRPAYCGLRLRNWLYVEWSDDQGTELYDYVHDPYELRNLAGKSAYADKEAQMRERTIELCSPTPPGFTW
jgi:arylsulfatase A-like enzyme